MLTFTWLGGNRRSSSYERAIVSTKLPMPVSVMVVMDSGSGKLIAGPEIHARGFVEDDAVFDEVKPAIVEVLHSSMREGMEDPYQLQQAIRRVIGRWVNNTHRRRPMIIPVVVEA